jgi:tRNA-Thr(GGU) m(6)t(6)A37 methyltransferase TsaA
MQQFQVKPIGEIKVDAEGMVIKLDRYYIPALKELDGFSHINVLWWFNGCDNEKSRNVLDMQSPYKKAPAVMGTFATRSPERPNPIALSTAQVTGIDYDQGAIRLAYLDADNGSPVVDLKPYTPSLDRVERPKVPAWCSHWPKSVEQSGDFAWENEFNF